MSSFFRLSSRIQKRSSDSSSGSIGFGPRFSPSTRPNVTVCGTRLAIGGATALIIFGEVVKAAASVASLLGNRMHR